MSKIKRSYWGYRIDTDRINFFQKELEHGRLRQGWGWKTRHDLRQLEKSQEDLPDDESGVYKNEKIRNSVKKGDILLVPRLPDWNQVAIVEATEDWKEGYRFDLLKNEDYGHVFPAKQLRHFVRYGAHVDGDIRTTLQARQRFWNMDKCGCSIEKILTSPEGELQEITSPSDKVESSVDVAFGQVREEYKKTTENFKKKVFDEIHKSFKGAEWESALVKMLKELYPSSHYQVEEVGGGKREAEHGTDVLIKILGYPVIDSEHGIAIQIKDHGGYIKEGVIDQINKASHWDSEGIKIIKKVVILTKAKRKENEHLAKKSTEITFIFSDDLRKIVDDYAERCLRKRLYDENW